MSYFRFLFIFLLLNFSTAKRFSTTKNAEKQCFIKVTMANPHEVPIQILDYLTPFEEPNISANYFKVMFGKEALDRYGPNFFRGGPTIEDYLVIRPFETWTKVINICEYYNLTRIGTYRIQLVWFGFTPDCGRTSGNGKHKIYCLEMSLDHDLDVLNDLVARWATEEMVKAEKIRTASFESTNVIEIIVDAWNIPKHPLEIQREN